jgi:SAM-dependent methyltransferase
MLMAADLSKCMKYDDCKRFPDARGRLRYRLRNGPVWVTDFGFHHTGTPPSSPNDAQPPFGDPLDERQRSHLEQGLHSNRQRFANHVELVKAKKSIPGLRVLDIGCGGGLFLSMLQQEGAQVVGIELSRGRAEYARTSYNLHVETLPVESNEIQNKYQEHFDVVTLWDVIEHVAYPQITLVKAWTLLKYDGYLLMDTPCRDSFYHRFGAISYAATGGGFPTFLNIMYNANSLLGHKQIFSTEEMQDILFLSGFQAHLIEKRHELSFPYEYYLSRLLRSRAMAKATVPLVDAFFRFVKIRNKLIVVAQKRECNACR